MVSSIVRDYAAITIAVSPRLSALVQHGLLERVRYRTEPDWYEYRLTNAGLDLYPAILTINAWADRHLLDPAEHNLHIHHRTCGAELAPVVVCENCRETISAADIELGAS